MPVFRFLSLSLLSFVFLCSCQRSSPNVQGEEIPEVAADTMPHLQAFELTGPKLSLAYKGEKREKIEAFVQKNWPGKNENYALLVVKNGQVLYEQYQGLADRKKDIPMGPDVPLHTASVSKVMTATAILIMIDEGRISLDQKVNTILPHFPYPDITVRTLLNHRSGLTNYAYYTDQNHIWDNKNALKNRDILDLFIANQTPLDFKTDRRFAYNNTNYAMLALIIEKLTGLDFPAAMKRMIFDPLGMEHTFVMDYDKDLDRIIPSYKGNGVEIGIDFLDAV